MAGAVNFTFPLSFLGAFGGLGGGGGDGISFTVISLAGAGGGSAGAATFGGSGGGGGAADFFDCAINCADNAPATASRIIFFFIKIV